MENKLTEADYARDHSFSGISLQMEQSIHHMQPHLTALLQQTSYLNRPCLFIRGRYGRLCPTRLSLSLFLSPRDFEFLNSCCCYLHAFPPPLPKVFPTNGVSNLTLRFIYSMHNTALNHVRLLVLLPFVSLPLFVKTIIYKIIY